MCKKAKLLFASEQKADNFIRFNAEEIAKESEKVPVRSYYCKACGGWHVTSKLLQTKIYAMLTRNATKK